MLYIDTSVLLPYTLTQAVEEARYRSTEKLFAGDEIVLQGQDAGITNWVNGPLHGWQELDVIPVRTLSTGGPATNQIITVNFDHTKSLTIPGIEDLTGFRKDWIEVA